MSFEDSSWWGYLDESMRDLMRQGRDLLTVEKERVAGGKQPYYDYAFVVFPAAKAYEGFLKKLFLDIGLIGKQQYFSEHFRIGRALSPTLPKRYRTGWVYGKLTQSCHGEQLPMKMWEVWKKGRNRTFHYFPDYHEVVTLAQAGEIIEAIAEMMSEALAGCRA